MIRRIREHVAQHNWFAVAIDLAIVIVGVFLGTQVSNWNQARIDRDKATSYRERLVHELEFNGRQFRQQQAYYTTAKRHGLAALAALQGRGGKSGEAFLVDAYQATQTDLSPPKRFIFDEMVSAGLVGLLGDEALQEKASDYYLALEANAPGMLDTPPYRDILRRHMPYAVQARICERCGDRLVYRGEQVIGIAVPDNCELGLSEAEIGSAVEQVQKVPQIDADLTRYVSALDQKLVLLKITTAQSFELADALRKARS
jgi:hypothetical protein